jgi:uncharacterized protein (TIGR00255 family)
MINSMTGYGQGRAQNPDFKLNVEMKSVNSRYLDINIRLPRKFNPFDDKIKQLIKSKITRGKVDVYINLEKSEREDIVIRPDIPLLESYVEAYQQIVNHFELTDRIDLNKIIRINDSLIVEDRELDPEATEATIMEAVSLALEGFIIMRQNEGEKLKLDILRKTDKIKEILVAITTLAPTISAAYRDKMVLRIQDLLEQVEDLDLDRINMEVAVYADKKAIDEELVRLDSHMTQVGALLESDEPIGRKLDFLLQEVNREVNTIGSKSPDYDISNHVVELKSEFEKIREQIQNIE